MIATTTNTTCKWRVWGSKIATEPSFTVDYSDADNTRIIIIACSDTTGTTDYVDMIITANTPTECKKEFMSQYTRGIFADEPFLDCMEIGE